MRGMGSGGGLNRRDTLKLAAGAAAFGLAGLPALARAAGPTVTFRTVEPVNFRIIADGLRFPEGPVAMDDGSVILTEIEAGRITRVRPDGTKETVAEPGGGPNGAAMGPDGWLWVTNNGGFEWHETEDGRLLPGDQPADYEGGRIEKINLETGAVQTVYSAVNGTGLRGPNDLVFDGKGGFWFTDLGKSRPRELDRGGLYYATGDGSKVEEVIFPIVMANGCGLSPDGGTVYVAESLGARLIGYDITGPGTVDRGAGLFPGRLVGAPGGDAFFDSMAVEADGSVCIATPVKGGITRITADGSLIEHTPLDDPFTTNLCFGGPDMMTCYVTLSARGALAAMDWPRPGLRLHHAA